MGSAFLAMIWANSPLASAYNQLWHLHLGIEIGNLHVSMHLLHWINDGLMAIFFLLVGLEIKREVLSGELSSLKKATLPAAAAVGGMFVPALIYTAVNAGTPAMNGWGIPMATDIAFALGVIVLLGKRVPASLKVFLVALAIVDDLGAVLAIAFFYTSELSVSALGIGVLLFIGLVAANRLGVRSTPVYVLLGIGLWIAFLKSGVHATLAGVLLAFTIPSARCTTPFAFMEKSRGVIYAFTGSTTPDQKTLTQRQEEAVQMIQKASRDMDSPLTRFEHALQGWVYLLIMPVFAFANAGVSLTGEDLVASLSSKVTLGIILGLFLGKQLGIFAFSWLAIKTGVAERPAGTSWRQLYGVSLLSGIGFTMSLFIASLAFGETPALPFAKMGILTASLLAGITGWYVLSSGSKQEDAPPPSQEDHLVEDDKYFYEKRPTEHGFVIEIGAPARRPEPERPIETV